MQSNSSQHSDKTPVSAKDVDDGCVQVAVRVRPMLPSEAGNAECVDVLKASASDNIETMVRLGGATGPKFTFDQVFGTQTQQDMVYENRVAPLVANCLEGYNATVLAYGQTGSGKTYTIMGGGMTTAMMQDEDSQGVLPRAIRKIYKELQHMQDKHATNYEYEVRLQFLEIYGEEIRDLLNPSGASGAKLSIRDVGSAEPEVVGATTHKTDTSEEALLCLISGMYRRVTASTAMNEGSSRSHAILSLIVEQSTTVNTGDQHNASNAATSKERVRSKTSRFNFVDLAGSERQKRTKATGQRLKEGIDINKGLLVLGNVISALGDPQKRGNTFVPYRDSKLTRLLKGSLGGNHKTLMIACISPSSSNLDETLNCLRYANRAKNIQNHAIVNLDSTSQLVANLKGKIQGLANDLIKAKTGRLEECTIPLEVIELLANDRDMESGFHLFSPRGPKYNDTTRSLRDGLTDASEREIEVNRLKAENESYRVQLESLSEGKDPIDALEEAYVTKATEYEQEIARLKLEVQTNRRSNDGLVTNSDRPNSPELSRLRSQMFGSLTQSITVDAEVEAEEAVIENLSAKYLFNGDDTFTEDFETNDNQPNPISPVSEASAAGDAEVFAISNKISAKESLIHQLQASQEKFESMREFYEEKLRELQHVVAEKEAETDKLSEELKKLDVGNSRGKELSERLKEKQAQVIELKRKQVELSRLTNVASRNESQIVRLRNDVKEMKHKKIDLQKQITSERKTHMTEVKKMKKESMQKDRELNKVKREVNKKSQEASKAHKIAKQRLEQVNQLKNKYKETEKRLRMKTVKQGVLKKAGLDPVLFGRRQGKRTVPDVTTNQKAFDFNVNKLRDFFDKKVADVSRQESLAQKLAQEWEEHLELTIQKEDLDANGFSDDNGESMEALESAITYREERIRQLASTLGKRSKKGKEKYVRGDGETFIFNKEFFDLVGKESLNNEAELVAKVLFGMVVRERRRISSLVRTASSLDEKVQETKSTLAEKEAAFNAYVSEQRLEAAATSQNQQEHLLSLMKMVKEGQLAEGEFETRRVTRSISRRQKSGSADDGNSRLLILANERIGALERQLNETELVQDDIKRYQEREQTAVSRFEEKSDECEELLEEIDNLRSVLRRIREVANGCKDANSPSIQNIISDVLNHPTSSPKSIRPKRRQSMIKSFSRPDDDDLISSDDDNDDEDPDWADDIMADLAIIAEGKMPPSLKQSKEVLEAEENNVFARLTNPQNFTFARKQRIAGRNRSTTRKNNSKSDSDRRNSTPEKETKSESTSRRGKEKLARASTNKEMDSGDSRNVFDRLLSPSNLTGTHKERFNRVQKKKGRMLQKAIEDQYVSVRGKSETMRCAPSDDTEDGIEIVLSEESFPEKALSNSSSGRSRVKNDYLELDVFERLNKTTTQAYQEKIQTNIADKILDELLLDGEVEDNRNLEEEHPIFEVQNERIKEYTNQDVFERLQRTSTTAYNSKTSGSRSPRGKKGLA